MITGEILEKLKKSKTHLTYKRKVLVEYVHNTCKMTEIIKISTLGKPSNELHKNPTY